MTNYSLRADIFPARITLMNPDGSETIHNKVRIILTLDHVYVFADGSPQFETVFEDRLTTYTPPTPATRVRKANELLDRSAKFTTEDGYSASFLRTGGCGCGSKLKTAPLSTLLPGTSQSQAGSTSDAV